MSRPRLIALLLALVTLLVYLPATHYDFINYDDQDYITDNAIVQNGLTWAGIKWAFTTGHASNWHPLTWLSHMLDCQLFALNPGGHHFVSVLFHAANAVLLFALLLRLTNSLWPAAFIAALFAWHPLHVESVAWIAERKDVLSTFFSLLALLSYTRYAQQRSRVEGRESSASVSALDPRPSTLDYWFALGFFALALMSKPMPVTLPFVLLLLDFWPLKRISFPSTLNSQFSTVFEKWPFFLLAAASGVVTFLVQSQQGGDAVASLQMVPLHYRVLNSVTAYGRYLLDMIWPVNLTVVYPLPEHLQGMYATAATSAAALFLISWLVWRGWRTQPYLAVGWLWFLGMLVPVIGLVQVGSAALADRYTYFPLVGIFIAVTFGVCALAKWFQIPKMILAAAAAAILTACLILTENQLHYWRDSKTLFAHALAVTKDNHVAHVNLGVALEMKGDPDKALAEYRAAEQLAPELYHVHNNIGNLLDKQGKPEEAVAEYQKAIAINPSLPFLHNSLGGALAELGRFPEAMAEFTNAMRLDPGYSAPHVRLGDTLLKQGRDVEAVAQFNEAVRLAPLDYQTIIHTAYILSAIDNPDIRDGKTALILAVKANVLTGGNQPLVFDVLGMAFAENGDFTNAQNCAQNALTLAAAAKLKKIEPIQQRLELYKNHQPWRESFLATNAPVKSE